MNASMLSGYYNKIKLQFVRLNLCIDYKYKRFKKFV